MVAEPGFNAFRELIAGALVLRAKLRVDGLKHAGQRIIDGEVAVTSTDLNVERDDDHVTDTEIVGFSRGAVREKLLILTLDAVAFVLAFELAILREAMGFETGEGLAASGKLNLQRGGG